MKLQILKGIVAALVLGLAVPAVAEECRQACSVVASTARKEASAGLKACRMECRGSASASECVATCRDTSRQLRRAVKTQLTECGTSCRPQNDCEEQCFEPVRDCLTPIVEQARTCADDCAAAADEAVTGCLGAADPFSCLREKAVELQLCMQGCAGTARDGAGACKATLTQCVAACSPETPCEAQCAPDLHDCLVPVVFETKICGRDCVYDAAAAAYACLSQPDRAGCLAEVAQVLGQCAIGCKGLAEQGAEQCRATFEGCVNTCLPPDPCRDACYVELRQCAAPAISDAGTCGLQCATDALADAAACLDAADASACLLEVEQALGACARGCVQTLIDIGDACRTSYRQCAGACLDDGTCRGSCLADAGQCLGVVADDTRGCVRGCADDGASQALPCLSAPDPKACLADVVLGVYHCAQDCRPIAVDGAAACKAALDGCVAQCPADVCRDGCIGGLEHCLATLATDGESCANDCLTSTWESGTQCLASTNKLACFSNVAGEGVLCGADCAANLRVGGAVCWHDYDSCGDVCTTSAP